MLALQNVPGAVDPIPAKKQETLLEQIIIELRILNIHMSMLTGEEVKKEDV